MAQFRKKPIVIDAIQWTGENMDEVLEFTGKEERTDRERVMTDELIIRTLEGDMHASKGDWIIRGVSGEYYPCKPDIFEKTYEPVV